MKVSVVPAQVTTVEDRIAGNLNFTQILLLSAPLFSIALLFLLIPPFGHFSLIKILMSVIISVSSSLMSIRIKERLLLDILKLRLTYYFRPHIYVQGNRQNFNSLDFNIHYFKPSRLKDHSIPVVESSTKSLSASHKLLKDKNYNVLFRTNSGGLSVEVSNNK